MKKLDISVVIVNYNVKDLLLTCLETLYKYQPESITMEVIVVDNNSSDDSCIVLKEKFPEIILIENKFNAGFSGANNQGMEISKGEYIFLLNPDTELEQDALSPLKNYLDQHKECSLVGPQLLNSDKTVQISTWKNHHVIDLVLETFYIYKIYNRLYHPIDQLNATFETKTLSGAALFFRKSLIEKIGMMDANLFWMEDIDFSFRAQKEGKIMYLKEAVIIHHSGQSQRKNYNVAICNQLLSKLKYYKKHFSFIAVILATLSCLIFIISRIVMFILLSPLKKLFRLKLEAYLYTFKRFWLYVLLNDKRLV